MRIACLQFAPQVGDVENNLDKADAILNHADPKNLDLLVLPELAFSGYNFKSRDHISPFLEEGTKGVSTLWARSMALKHDCTVVVGYPEKKDEALERPTENECYNSAVVMNDDGEVVANYRKTHLYYTDETWALEGPSGFYQGHLAGLGKTALGICMDINPYKFEAPWTKFEFSQHAVDSGARLIIVSMAWLTNDDPQTFNATPSKPDTDTLLYWIARLEPLISMQSDKEIIVIFANRCGTEDEATYAGTSTVLGIRSGEVFIYGILGRGDDGLLMVDTDAAPYAKLAHIPIKADENEGDKIRGEEGEEGEDDGRRGLRGVKDHLSDVETDAADKGSQRKLAVKQPAMPPDSLREQTTPMDMYAPYQDDHMPSLRVGKSDDNSDSPITHESIASNPNPNPFRKLVIPSDPYMLQRYLELESPNAPFVSTGSTSHESPFHHFTFAKSSNHSFPSKKPSSSNLARKPKKPRKPHESTHDQLVSLSLKDDDQDSVRSDVSVWNNQPGRVPNIVSPITRPSP